MPPEPDSHAVLARAAHARILAGEDITAVLLDAMREAVALDRQRRRAPFDDELTPTVSAQDRLQPTVPAPPRLPRGVPYDSREPTQRTPVPPPTKRRG